MGIVSANPYGPSRALNAVETELWLQQIDANGKVVTSVHPITGKTVFHRVEFVIRHYFWNEADACDETLVEDSNASPYHVVFATTPRCFGAPNATATARWVTYNHDILPYLLQKVRAASHVPGWSLSSDPHDWVISSGLALDSEQKGPGLFANAVFDSMVLDVAYGGR